VFERVNNDKIARNRRFGTGAIADMSADAVMPISVVIERRASNSQWDDHQWRPIGVLPHAALEHGKVLAEGDGWAQYQAGTLHLELFRGETEGYLTNLSQNPPVVFVILRPNEEGEGLEFEPFLATVCPYEAMGYTAGGDEIVEGVPMPPEIMTWLREFVAHHHVDQPFLKRKNKRHQDEYGGKRPRGEREKGIA
jgi:Protein of unknown function (DUF3305)